MRKSNSLWCLGYKEIFPQGSVFSSEPEPPSLFIPARLPFKRLNLVPKEKGENGSEDMGSSQSVSVEGKVSDLETSLDNLENGCHIGSDLDCRPKLVNGKGPLDDFIRNRIKTSIGQSMVIIDLTEDSNDQPDSTADPEASLSRETVSGVSGVPDQGLSKVIHSHELAASPAGALSDSPCESEEALVGSETLERNGSSQEGTPQRRPEPTGGPRRCSQKEQDGWSEAGGILFRGKVPLVVLQDILAVEPPQAKPLRTPLDKSLTSGTEVLESCPEEDSTLSHSPLSSSPTSSPEGQLASGRQHHDPSPSPTSTPVRRVSISTELQDKEQLREEKEKLKEEARRAKEEARRKKEEEKELKEKERREKREKDEKEKAEKQRLKEERRKERQEALEPLPALRQRSPFTLPSQRIKAEKAEITRFFQKPKTPQAPKTLAGSCGKFAPFEIKEHMVLAPRCRAAFNQDRCDQLDQLLQQQSGDGSFLEELKGRRPLRSGPTRLCSRNADVFNSDMVIVGSGKVASVPERRKFGQMKLLQFSENHRPAYWGTWNKKTAIICPRNPWAQDKVGLSSEACVVSPRAKLSLLFLFEDDDDEVGEDEDEDDGFFVPHGYLSEDEGVTEECADPENHKVRQKLKAKEWDEYLAKGKRFRVLQPVVIGCVWAATGDSCSDLDLKVLQQFTACLLETVPSEEEQAPKASKREKRDQQILAQLLPLLHGNVNGSKVIIREFQEHCRRGLLSSDAGGPPSPASRPQTPTATSEDAAVPSKARLKRIISENSVYEKRPDFRMCWYVHPQVLKSFDQEHLPVPCQWSYVTTVPSAPREDSGSVPATGPSQGVPAPLKRKSAGSMCITQFMKKRRHDGQVGAGDVDGFQADTEEEEEEDGDCMSVDVPDIGVRMDTSENPLPASPLCAS
uniref:Chromatin assembly factor 1 subunit A n=1 Tax=Sciurus vulgaris TaxID=55149 RepID=A0A8D2DDJ4_SCIVU